MHSKLTLYDFTGKPIQHFVVDEAVIPTTPTTTVSPVGHLIFIADASGSMYGDMPALRAMIEKLLVGQELRDDLVSASLVSFSSSGDTRIHFDHVKVQDIMAPGSSYVQAIRDLNVRGLTCMSQGIATIPKLVRKDEPTAVVILSDGYANDRSPGAERREIDVLVEQIRNLPNVFVNTIALRDWADYKLLAFIANACSGTCFSVPSVKEVFNIIHDTTKVLTGGAIPAMDVVLGAHDYQAFVSKAARKTVAGSTDLLIRGIQPTDDGTIFRYRRVEADQFRQLELPEASLAARLAFASGKLSEGEINVAKYALISTRLQDLIQKHARALVNTEIAAFGEDLARISYDAHTLQQSNTYGVANAGETSVLTILGVLSSHTQHIEVDLHSLQAGYKSRSVKRVPGSRAKDGTVTTPHVKTAYRDAGDFVPVSSFDLNRNTATVNMLVRRKIDLQHADSGNVISEVAGVKLDLESFNNYTLVGDGSLSVESLRLRIHSKALFRHLVTLGVFAADTVFVPGDVYTIVFKDRPLIGYDTSFDPKVLDGMLYRVARARTLSSILAAVTKGESSDLTSEQIAALKAVYVTPSMNVSLPTMTEYADLQTALADGSVDTRISYKVDFGSVSHGILNPGDLYSANEFLARHYTQTVGGTEVKKPVFASYWDCTFGAKVLSSRTTVNAVDALQKPIFDAFLATGSRHVLTDILRDLGQEPKELVKAWLEGQTLDKDSTVEAFIALRRQVEGGVDELYTNVISPLVFFIGATGLVPDSFKARAQSADAIRTTYPTLSVGKAEDDSTFYVVGDTILTIKASPEYFSTQR